ncbi:MAG TPA: hypothetical protein VNM40_01170 [Candidatus Paceibacterota bacterium]|nr:hypothetical protein [Candidatus Paceibacterota bacterium]
MIRVFTKTRSIMIFVASSAALYAAVLVTQDLGIIRIILADPALNAGDKVPLLMTFLHAALFTLPLQTAAYVGLLSLLIGLNVALLEFYFRMYRAAPSAAAAGSGVVGALAAILGFGCAACGSLFLASLAASVGGVGFLAFLPYGGEELGHVGIALLMLSSFLLVRAINRPPVCPI